MNIRKIIVALIGLMFLVNNYAYAYNDINKTHWAYDAVDALSKSNILSGYPDGTFYPDKNITRAEFITVLMKIIEPNVDVSSNLGYWADGSISLAREKNILIDEDYSKFEPDKDITRREICLMIYRSMEEFNSVDVDKLKNKKFRDIDYNNIEESRIVAILSHLGILNGYPDETVRLDKNSSRAELCAFMNNFMKSGCILISMINDSDVVLYENDIASTKEIKLPEKLRKWRNSKDISYLTTEIKEICMFEFNNPPDKYKEVFEQFYNSESKYLQYRKKFGENNYVIAVLFNTTNNTYDLDLYAGYEFLHLNFPEEEITIIDAFDTDEINRQLKGNANVGEFINPGKSRDTSAFYIVNKLPKSKIRFDRDVTYNKNISSFHSLIVNLESR